MALIVLRCVFLMVATGLGVYYVRTGLAPPDSPGWWAWTAFAGTLGTAAAVIALDMVTRRKSVAAISAVYFGLIVGLFLAYVRCGWPWSRWGFRGRLKGAVKLLLSVLLCYVCISLLMQTKDDFRFIIPYIEFSKELKGRRPYVLDTSVIIDGRIADIVETNFFDTQLVIPRFVITELPGDRRQFRPPAPQPRAAAAWTSSTACAAIPRWSWRSTTASCPTSPVSRWT